MSRNNPFNNLIIDQWLQEHVHVRVHALWRLQGGGGHQPWRLCNWKYVQLL